MSDDFELKLVVHRSHSSSDAAWLGRCRSLRKLIASEHLIGLDFSRLACLQEVQLQLKGKLIPGGWASCPIKRLTLTAPGDEELP